MLLLLCSSGHDSYLLVDRGGWSNDHGCSHPIVICTHSVTPMFLRGMQCADSCACSSGFFTEIKAIEEGVLPGSGSEFRYQ